MAPDAVAERSSSATKGAVETDGSTIAELEVASISIVDGSAVSKALAAGRIVATSSTEVVTAQIATNFFELLIIADFTVCSPSIHL